MSHGKVPFWRVCYIIWKKLLLKTVASFSDRLKIKEKLSTASKNL